MAFPPKAHNKNTTLTYNDNKMLWTAETHGYEMQCGPCLAQMVTRRNKTNANHVFSDETLAMLTHNTGDPAAPKSYHEV